MKIEAIDDGRNTAMGLAATFASEEDYQVYAKHEDHVAFIKGSILPIAAGRTAVQFTDPSPQPTPATAAAVTHAVLMTLKPEATAAQKAAVVDSCRALPAKIPEIRTMLAGEQISVRYLLVPRPPILRCHSFSFRFIYFR
jgi:hypothetical protein